MSPGNLRPSISFLFWSTMLVYLWICLQVLLQLSRDGFVSDVHSPTGATLLLMSLCMKSRVFLHMNELPSTTGLTWCSPTSLLFLNSTNVTLLWLHASFSFCMPWWYSILFLSQFDILMVVSTVIF